MILKPLCSKGLLRKGLLGCATVLVLTVPSYGQRQVLDSLLQTLRPPKDTAYAARVLELAFAYRLTNLDSMLLYAQEGAALSAQLDFPLGVAKSLHVLAIHANIQGKRDTAIATWNRALELAQQLGDRTLEASILNGLGAAYFVASEYAESLKYYRATLRIHQEMDNTVGIFTVTNNLMNLYSELGAYTEALESSQRALEAARKLGDKRREGLTESNRGNILNKLKKLPEARQAYTLSLQLLEGTAAYGQQASSWLGMGNTYAEEKNYAKADSCIAQAYALFSKVGEVPGIIQARIVAGNYARVQSNYELAAAYYTEAMQAAEKIRVPRLRNNVYTSFAKLELAYKRVASAAYLVRRQQEVSDSIGNPEFRADSYELRAQLAALRGQYEQAYSLLSLYKQLSDSLAVSDQAQQVRNLEASYRLDRQDAELARIEERSVQARRQTNYFYGLLAAGLLLIALGVFIWQDRRFRKVRERELASRNEELDQRVAEQTAEITAQAEELTQANHELQATIQHLQETQQQLVHAEKMASLGQLTAGIAHEINNPINFISANITPLRQELEELKGVVGYSESLLQELGGPAALARLQTYRKTHELEDAEAEIDLLLGGIASGAQRTAEIVRGLRNFSRIDESEFKVANLHDQLESTLLLLKSEYSGRIEVVRQYADVPDFACYPGQLGQLFMNLLVNAIQAIEGEGVITVRTALEGSADHPFVRIEIQDTGVGIPPALQSRIFEPFFTTKDVGKGTGLGLSISHSIVEKHGGQIEVASAPGKGTTFTVHLPLKQI